MAELYSVDKVARIFGLAKSRLRSWARRGFLRPSGRDGKRAAYTFEDLVAIRAAKELLDSGVALRRVRKGLAVLRESLPSSARLGAYRIRSDGRRVVVRKGGTAFDPETGQLVLDFDVRSVSDQVVRKLAPLGPRRAQEWYLLGCRLDENDETLDQAEQAYRRAIELDPYLAHALTNLGNLRYRVGAPEEARALYERALDADADQPEAHYNLGFLAYEEGRPIDAIPFFERAVALDPGFADAHFNLALALTEVGRPSLARSHWKRYLDVEPKGPWADIARRHLRMKDQ